MIRRPPRSTLFPTRRSSDLAAGGTGQDVADAARDTAAATRTFFAVDTLEHLRRGGRIGAAAALLGGALAVKPVLHVADGQVVPLERVRTSGRALNRPGEVAVSTAGVAAGFRAGHHLDAPAR